MCLLLLRPSSRRRMGKGMLGSSTLLMLLLELECEYSPPKFPSPIAKLSLVLRLQFYIGISGL